MKLLIILFACFCLNAPEPVKAGKKKAAPKKEAKSSFHLAPSILIVKY